MLRVIYDGGALINQDNLNAIRTRIENNFL